MVIHPMLLPYNHDLNNKLLKYLLYRFSRQFGINQIVLVIRIPTMSCEYPKLCSHTDKNGENSLVQVAKALEAHLIMGD